MAGSTGGAGRLGFSISAMVVVVHVPVVIAAVEAHFGGVRTLRRLLQFADLFEADDLGPKLVRFFQIAKRSKRGGSGPMG